MKTLFISFIVFFCFEAKASQVVIDGSFENIQLDQLGNLYAISNKTLFKFNEKGILLYKYNYSKIGVSPIVDVSTPMKTLLYFSEFKKLVLLDNRLLEIKTMDVTSFKGILNPTMVCFSKDQNFWIFDATMAKVLKYDQQGEIILESQKLPNHANSIITPVRIKEEQNILFIVDMDKGIYMFDIIGNFIDAIPLKGLSNFQIIDNSLFYFKESKLNSIDLTTRETKAFMLTEFEAGIINILKSNKATIILYKDKITFNID